MKKINKKTSKRFYPIEILNMSWMNLRNQLLKLNK